MLAQEARGCATEHGGRLTHRSLTPGRPGSVDARPAWLFLGLQDLTSPGMRCYTATSQILTSLSSALPNAHASILAL